MIQQRDFGRAKLFTLTNDNKVSISILNYGGIIQSIMVPDRNDELADIALGFDELDDYLNGNPYFGALIGRYGNRIGAGEFTLDGKKYSLVQNKKGNHLHGGVEGFDKKYWDCRIVGNELVLSHCSVDLEEGYPGQLDVEVRYELDNENCLSIKYKATTNKTTLVNLTNHSYFNLAGKGDILNHEAMINASHITAIDDNMIPTGELMKVESTAFDFRKAKKIGADIKSDHPQMEFTSGYDHNYVLDYPGCGNLSARVVESESGRTLEVYTDEPGIQMYTGNWLGGIYNGKFGQNYGPHSVFCMETQHYPDSPNHDHFPSTVLKPGEVYSTKTIYKFGIES
jgi:aldose 1-epimerase